MMDTVFLGGLAETQQFAKHYQRVAQVFQSHFLDTASFIKSSEVDGIHLDVVENKLLGERVAELAKSIL